MSKGLTESVQSPSSSWAPVFSESITTPSRVDDGRGLLRDEIHAVEERGDHQEVEVLVSGDRLREVLVDPQVDRHPVRRAVTVVHDRDDRLDPLHVLGVFGDVEARGLEVGDERDALAELGMLREKGVESRKAAQDVLREIGAVHADDEVVAPAPQKHLLVLETSSDAAARSSRSASIPSG